MMMPVWAAITPELVPRNELQSAIALNSLGINVARTIGPALAGIIVSFAGTGAVFVLNALTYFLVNFTLFLWRRAVPISELPSKSIAFRKCNITDKAPRRKQRGINYALQSGGSQSAFVPRNEKLNPHRLKFDHRELIAMVSISSSWVADA